jgi:hypothetical protein
MLCTAGRAIVVSVCLGLLATRSDAGEDSELEIERWVPAAAVSFDILGQRSEGAVESDNFTGPPISDGGCETRPGVRIPGACREPVPSTLQLTPSAHGTDTTTAALVKLSLELMTPRLAEGFASPRVFAHADGSLAFAFRRKLAGAGSPGAMNLPPATSTIGTPVQPNISEETITGQGNRAFSELQTGVFTAGAGIAFTANVFGRTVRIKPSFDYLRQEIEFDGRANRAIQIRGSNFSRPDGLEDFRLLSFSAHDTRIQHGVGGGLELEADTQHIGPFLLSVFGGARAYHMLGDLDVTLCSDVNQIGPSFSPGACAAGTGERVVWHFEPDDFAWVGGVGLRFRYVP